MNIVGEDNEIIFDDKLLDLKKLRISIVGSGNKVIFNGRVNIKGNLSINIKADRNNIVIEENVVINREVSIFILPAGSGSPSSENSVYIGKECFFNGVCNLVLAESNNSINI